MDGGSIDWFDFDLIAVDHGFFVQNEPYYLARLTMYYSRYIITYIRFNKAKDKIYRYGCDAVKVKR